MANMNTAKAPRVTVRGQNRGNIQGFSITSRAGGLFGTQIFVRHLSTALCIKALMKTQPADCSAKIDALIHEDATRGRA